MGKISFSVKINSTRICVLISSLIMTFILVSEQLFYFGLLKKGIINGVLKTAIYAVLILCAFYLILKTKYKWCFTIKIFFVFSILTVMSTVFGVTQDVNVIRQSIHILYFLAIFVIFYLAQFKLKNDYTVKWLCKISVIVILVSTLVIVKNVGINIGNTVYYSLLFLPVISMLEKKSTRAVFYFLEFFTVLLSNKRTALIAFIVYILTYELMVNKNISNRKLVFKIISYIILVCVIYFGFPIVVKYLGITVFDELSISNIQADGGSNRVFIYQQLVSNLPGQGIKNWLIGRGYNAVLFSRVCTDGMVGNYVSAHNDFLEILFDYGVMGITTYILFIFSMIKKLIEMSKNKYKYFAPFASSIVMVLVISMTSHLIIYLNYYAIMFAFWGICLADYILENKRKTKSWR